MSIGTYGITRPADVSTNDIDIYWAYTPNRQTPNNSIYKIGDASELL